MAQIVHTRLMFKERLFPFCCVNYVLTFCCIHIENPTSSIKSKTNIKNLIRMYSYIRIFSDTNIRSYHIRIIFLIRIYSDIRSYCFFDTNISGYSFVPFFYTNISGKNLASAPKSLLSDPVQLLLNFFC